MNTIQMACVSGCGYAGTKDETNAARAVDLAMSLWPKAGSGIQAQTRKELRRQRYDLACRVYYVMKAEKGVGFFDPFTATILWILVKTVIGYLIQKYLDNHVFATTVDGEVACRAVAAMARADEDWKGSGTL